MIALLSKHLQAEVMYSLSDIFDWIKAEFYDDKYNYEVVWLGLTWYEVNNLVIDDLKNTAAIERSYGRPRIEWHGDFGEYTMNRDYVLNLHKNIVRRLQLRTKDYYTVEEVCAFLRNPPNVELYYDVKNTAGVYIGCWEFEKHLRKIISADFNGKNEFEKMREYSNWCVWGPKKDQGKRDIDAKNESLESEEALEIWNIAVKSEDGICLADELPEGYSLKQGKPYYLMNRDYVMNLRYVLETQYFKQKKPKSQGEIERNIRDLDGQKIADYAEKFYINLQKEFDAFQEKRFQDDIKHRNKLHGLITYMDEHAYESGFSFTESTDELKTELDKISEPWNFKASYKAVENIKKKTSEPIFTSMESSLIADTLYKLQNKAIKQFNEYCTDRYNDVGEATQLWKKYCKLVWTEIKAVEDDKKRKWLKMQFPLDFDHGADMVKTPANRSDSKS